MNELKFHFEWEDPQGARGPELRATWARLEILADGIPVTRVFDVGSRSVRDAVYCPLYPLAEWLATRWWFLFNEVQSPGTARQRTYRERHSIRFAREGFALPDLELSPGGDKALLGWKAGDMPSCRVRFLEEGSAVLDAAGVRDSLSGFVAAVKGRLESEGIFGTLLQEEWDAVERCDDSEREFCEVAAAMGLDPYAISDDMQDRIIRIHGQLPLSLAAEFFCIANDSSVDENYSCLTGELKSIRDLNIELPSLVKLKTCAPQFDNSMEPWRQGYEFARDLRAEIEMNGGMLRDMSSIGKALGVNETTLTDAIVFSAKEGDFYDALVGINSRGSPGFVVHRRRETSQRFAFCRSLFEYLLAPDADSPALVSMAHSDRQKRNRAFAAEFLAPSHLIKRRLHGDAVDDEQISELSEEFGVSSFVVLHQIRNHELAAITPTFIG